MYFISRLVIVAPFIWYSVKYSLNHFNALPVKNIPVYATISTSVAILGPSYLSFNNIYIRYPLSLIRVLLNCLTAGNLTALVPMLFSLLLRANWPVFICSITNLSCPVVTTYKSGSNNPIILVLLLGSNSSRVIIAAAFSSILLVL